MVLYAQYILLIVTDLPKDVDVIVLFHEGLPSKVASSSFTFGGSSGNVSLSQLP